MHSAAAGSDPPATLEGIRASLAGSNPALYRHIALYLQVLRTVLPQRVQQACFHLATQVHAVRYLRLSDAERLALHSHLQELVGRCSSLLTVEQLAALAQKLQREEQQRRSVRQQELLQRLMGAAAAEGDGDPDVAGQPGGVAGVTDQPPGSVQLGFSLPLVGGSFSWPDARLAGAGSMASEASEQEGAGDRGQTDPGEPDDDGLEEGLSEALLQEALLEAGALPPLLDPSALAALMASAEGQEGVSGSRLSDGSSQADGSAPGSAPGGSAAGEVADPEGLPSWLPSDPPEALLPRDPLLLLQWLEALEQALVRRLRNLSHAINVDLLRFGLSRGLLPESLLDAVLQGQIETLSSPANVLRLQLPFGLRPGAPPLQVLAILLRPVDLEMEEPRLRTCRRRLQQHRQEVRRMAQQYRRLQRRLQAHEAERLWLHDIHRTGSSPG